jgi:transaldolase
MEFFLDTASIEEVRRVVRWGVVRGLTTNQKKFFEQGRVDFKETALELISLIKGPVSLELTKRALPDLMREAEEYYGWDPKHVVIKVPMRNDGSGLEAMHELHSRGIPVNATVMMACAQALLAAKAGATFASLFYNRIRESGGDPVLVIGQTRKLFDQAGFETKIIAASIRQPTDVVAAALAGADIVTMPYGVLAQLPAHPMSEQVIKEFDEAWEKYLKLVKVHATAETIRRT